MSPRRRFVIDVKFRLDCTEFDHLHVTWQIKPSKRIQTLKTEQSTNEKITLIKETSIV
jgi:hypothetical protein